MIDKIKYLVKKYNCDEKDKSSPYIKELILIVDEKYNPNYGDDKICKCGHPYHRHFDSYENMENVGCKYCGCYKFEEK